MAGGGKFGVFGGAGGGLGASVGLGAGAGAGESLGEGVGEGTIFAADDVVDEDDVLVDHVGFGSKPPGSLQRNWIVRRTISIWDAIIQAHKWTFWRTKQVN